MSILWMDWPKTVGENIRRVRLAAGISQEELAHRAGLTPSYIGQVERGRRNTSVTVLGKVADALGTTPGRFFETSR
ncbi:helix-turn-helix domain-containing protein [Caulobacter sp. KR2-114]|uniref:helix-turn-helix domain-containing protein n=1 Tax=Caulobacter sp. KR2-114 TaxID=3400912 RepID=UPI003BFA7F46